MAFIANDWDEDLESLFEGLMRLQARVICVNGERSENEGGRVAFLARPFIDRDVDIALHQLGFDA